jgi:hypothetical protein
MSDERFDAKIDEVAREMTQGDLPPHFRAGVVARIQSGNERGWTLRPAWVLAPLAVAAAVLLAVFVVRGPWRSEQHVAQGVRTQVPGDVGLKSERSKPAIEEPSATETSQTLALVPPRLDTMTAVRLMPNATYDGGLASDLAPASIEIKSLDVEAMEAMEIAPLGVDAMESIDVPRLDVAPLEVPAVAE